MKETYQKQSVLVFSNVLSYRMPLPVVVRPFSDFRSKYASVILDMGIGNRGAFHECLVVVVVRVMRRGVRVVGRVCDVAIRFCRKEVLVAWYVRMPGKSSLCPCPLPRSGE